MLDASQLEDFLSRVDMASSQFKPKMAEVLDRAGEEFLDIVQGAIELADNVDTRTLLSSFSKGAGNGIYELNEGGLTLTIGTNVQYAAWVNDGHKQKPGRFIPGHWSGERFIYEPGAREGMVLKASFVEGSHYFDYAVSVFRKMFPGMVQEMTAQLLNSIF